MILEIIQVGDVVLESEGYHAGVVYSSLERGMVWKVVLNKIFHEPQEACVVTVIT